MAKLQCSDCLEQYEADLLVEPRPYFCAKCIAYWASALLGITADQVASFCARDRKEVLAEIVRDRVEFVKSGAATNGSDTSQ